MTTKSMNRPAQDRTDQSTHKSPAPVQHPLAQAQDQVGNAELQRRILEEKAQGTQPPEVPDGSRSEQALTQIVPAWDATGPQSCEQSPESRQGNAQRDIALEELAELHRKAGRILHQVGLYGERLGLSSGEVQAILNQRTSFVQYRRILEQQPPSEVTNSGVLVQAQWTLDGVERQFHEIRESVAEEAVRRAEVLRHHLYNWLSGCPIVNEGKMLKDDVHDGMMEAEWVYRDRSRVSSQGGLPSPKTLLKYMDRVEAVARTYHRHQRSYRGYRRYYEDEADHYIEIAEWVNWGAKLYLGKFAYGMCTYYTRRPKLGEFCESATNVGTAVLETASTGFWNDWGLDETLLQTALAAAMATVYEMAGGVLGKKLGGPLIGKLQELDILKQAAKTVTIIIAETLSKKAGDIPLTIGMTFLEALSQSKESGSSDGLALQFAYAKTKQALADYWSTKQLTRDGISTIAGQGAKKASGE
jgi:hypothetical protein